MLSENRNHFIHIFLEYKSYQNFTQYDLLEQIFFKIILYTRNENNLYHGMKAFPENEIKIKLN